MRLLRCFETTNWSEAAGRTYKRENMVFALLMWNFAILTTLYADLENYTYMTSGMESSLCVSIGHMLKERTFWNFLCIISRPMLTCIMCRCTSQVPRDLVRLYGAWLLSLALWMPSRDVREAEIAVHEAVRPNLKCMEIQHLDYVIQDCPEVLHVLVDERWVWTMQLRNNFGERKMRK